MQHTPYVVTDSSAIRTLGLNVVCDNDCGLGFDCAFHFRQRYHLLTVGVPELQIQATPYFKRVPIRGSHMLQLRHFTHYLGQSIKRDPRVKMMHMVIPNIPSEPLHDRIHLHIARRLQGGVIILPVMVLTKLRSRKIMLTIEQIRTCSESNKKRKKPCHKKHFKSQHRPDQCCSRNMKR